jgi:hypothetical protein
MYDHIVPTTPTTTDEVNLLSISPEPQAGVTTSPGYPELLVSNDNDLNTMNTYRAVSLVRLPNTPEPQDLSDSSNSL